MISFLSLEVDMAMKTTKCQREGSNSFEVNLIALPNRPIVFQVARLD